MTADEWIEAFAAASAGPAPTPAEREAILELAGIAAHASERIAAPLTCWYAGKVGMSMDDALELARSVDPRNFG